MINEEHSGAIGAQTAFKEYCSLLPMYFKLYYGNRILAAQNFILSCKLQMWTFTFLCMKVRIFFMRLAHGFPVDECWPRK
jgi:hypothetical protein